MILELAGSRILAPYVGNSLPVWTGLIGIILGSLSLGYYLGGKLADERPQAHVLGWILFVASLFLCITPLLSVSLLPVIAGMFLDIRLSALAATLLLFALPSILLGMVSPYAIRLSLETVQTSGMTAGKLYAISTIGSIAGTFFAGFFLIAFFGSKTIFYLLAASSFILALLLFTKNKLSSFLIFLSLVLICLLLPQSLHQQTSKLVIEKDTMYNNVRIIDQNDYYSYQTVRELFLGNARNSATYLDNPKLVYPYANYYRLIDHFVPELSRVLMIGGGGYAYPKNFISTHPEASIDIVEIDPELTTLAEHYFFFKPNEHTTVFHEDARTFINREEYTYDAILIDAFSDYHHPFQLTTHEALTHMAEMLHDDGIVITNIVSSILGEKGKVLRAEYRTYTNIFPYVAVFPVNTNKEPYLTQNIMLIAAKQPLNFSSSNAEFEEYLGMRWDKEIPVDDVPLLTDDFAPVEFYAMQATQ